MVVTTCKIIHPNTHRYKLVPNMQRCICISTTRVVVSWIQNTNTSHFAAQCTVGSTDRRALRWRHIERDGSQITCVSIASFNRLFRRRSNKTSKPRVTSLCEGNSPAESPHKGPVTRKMFPFDDVITEIEQCSNDILYYPVFTADIPSAWAYRLFRG